MPENKGNSNFCFLCGFVFRDNAFVCVAWDGQEGIPIVQSYFVFIQMLDYTAGSTMNKSIPYIPSLKRDCAKDLLAEGESVIDTAEQVGYTDTFYFNKKFSKEYGISPGEYKHNIRG